MKSLAMCIFLIVIGVVLFTATIRGVWGNTPIGQIKNKLDQATQPFELSPERGRFVLTQNLSEKRSFALGKEQVTTAMPDVGYHNGKFFIYFAPGMSIFALPFYELGKQFDLAQVFTYSVVSIFAIFNLITIFLICKHILRLPIWSSLVASLIYGFASISWSYSGTLYQHQSTTFFILFSLYAVYMYKIQAKWGFLWGFVVWLNYSLAILIDYPNALLMLPIMIYFLIVSIKLQKGSERYKISVKLALIYTTLFFIIITFLHGYYNYTNFGGWTKISGRLQSYKLIHEKKQNDVSPNNKTNNLNKDTNKKKPTQFFQEDRIVRGMNTLTIAPDKGIFIFNPIFIFGIIGMVFVFKNMTLEKGVLVSLVILNFLLYSSWYDPWGGWAFGPRYLIPSMAILSIFVAIFLSEFKYKFILKVLALPLLAISVAISLLGTLTTNAIPPISEAIYLKSKYGFPLALDYLIKGKSSSFIYNNFLKSDFTLVQYYLVIFAIVMVIFILVMFIFPLFERRREEHV